MSLPLAINQASAYDWLQFGGDAQHSGNNTLETTIDRTNVNALRQQYQITLAGRVDGTPVFIAGVNTANGLKDLLFVTTTDGRIVALDAHTGATVWAHQYGPGSCRINGTGGACYTTSSPAIDPNRGYVYSYGLDGYVHKYVVGDGSEIMTAGWPQRSTLKGFDEKASSALAIAASGGTTYLYVTHGGYPGDQGDYQGHVTAINLTTGAQNVFNTACSDQPVHFQSTTGNLSPTCPARQNAIWSRPGVIYDPGTDHIFMGTGNAFTDGAGRFDGVHNWSESVIALNPDGTGGSGLIVGKPLDSYTPGEHETLDNQDADVGSTAPAILPIPPTTPLSNVQHLAVQSGKDAKLRLIDLANLSGVGGPGHIDGNILPNIGVPQGGGVLSQPAVWVNPADNSTWVFIVNTNGASGLKLNVDVNGKPSLATQWTIAQGGTSPIVVGGMLFYIDGGTVRALDAVSSTQLWSIANPGGTHWESLIVADGTVYATDEASHVTAFAVPTIRGDFNADGSSDILLRRATDGAVMMWLMNGLGISSFGIIGTGTEWTVAGTGDFNGDGKADILWRRASDGAVMMWLMNGIGIVSVGIVGTGTDWTIAGVGDFDGDGKADILWRRASDGTVMMWLMNGMGVSSLGVIATGTDWSVAGVGDFNDDGKADILMRRASDGAVMMWLMNGMAAVSVGTIGTGTDWSIAAIGDFNGDAKADILWRRASDGTVMMWLMNGLSVSSLGIIGTGTDWSVAAAGDFNGDGKSDILWQRGSDGAVMMWLMNGMNVTSLGTIGSGTAWSIAAPK